MKQLSAYSTVIIAKLRSAYYGFSAREQRLLLGAIAVIMIIAAIMIVQPIRTVFSDQELALMKSEQELKDIGGELNRYLRLKQRRTEVEQEFKSVEIKEGALSHLEGIIRDKGGISQGAFTIKDQPPRPFGAGYEQAFFNVSFATTDYSKLIDLLQELVDGPKPLVLKRIDLKRSRGGDKLEVNLEISSITKEK